MSFAGCYRPIPARDQAKLLAKALENFVRTPPLDPMLSQNNGLDHAWSLQPGNWFRLSPVT